MFGDKLIIGHTYAKIGSNGRLILPTFTKAEKDDLLVLQKSSFDSIQVLKIYAYNEYLGIISRLQKLRDNTSSKKEYEKYDAEISKICFALECLLEVDKDRRIVIPRQLLSDLNWQLDEEYHIDGLGTSLMIRPKNK